MDARTVGNVTGSGGATADLILGIAIRCYGP